MILVNNKKSNILLKAVALVVACVFFVDTISYAAPSIRTATNLAAESRFKPFSDRFGSFSSKYDLDFNTFAMALLAAGEIREKINLGILIKKRDLQEINRKLTKIGTRLGIEDDDFGERELKASKKGSQPRKYKYVTFYFGDEKKRIEARFIKDHESLIEEERQELGVRTEEDRGYFVSSGLPELEGVWFVEGEDTFSELGTNLSIQLGHRVDSVVQLSSFEPHLLAEDEFGEVLRQIACPNYITEETITQRSEIARRGKTIAGMLAPYGLDIAITVLSGSVLKGYASMSSDLDGPTVIVSSLRREAALSETERFRIGSIILENFGGNNIITIEPNGKVRTWQEGLSIDNLNSPKIFGNGVWAGIFFRPILYVSSPDFVEKVRADIIERITIREKIDEWKRIQRDFALDVNFSMSSQNPGEPGTVDEDIAIIRKRPMLEKALRSCGVDTSDEVSLSEFIIRRKEATWLPSLHVMAKIYASKKKSADTIPVSADRSEATPIDPAAMRSIILDHDPDAAEEHIKLAVTIAGGKQVTSIQEVIDIYEGIRKRGGFERVRAES